MALAPLHRCTGGSQLFTKRSKMRGSEAFANPHFSRSVVLVEFRGDGVAKRSPTQTGGGTTESKTCGPADETESADNPRLVSVLRRWI